MKAAKVKQMPMDIVLSRGMNPALIVGAITSSLNLEPEAWRGMPFMTFSNVTTIMRFDSAVTLKFDHHCIMGGEAEVVIDLGVRERVNLPWRSRRELYAAAKVFHEKRIKTLPPASLN